MSRYKDPTFEAVEIGETFGPIAVDVDERYIRTACFYLSDYGADYRPEAGSARLAPSTAIARDLQQLFLTRYDSNRIVGLHQAEEIEFHAPVRFGSRVTLTGECVDKYERRGKGYFVLRCDAHDEDGTLLVRQYQTEIMAIPQGLSFEGPGTAPASAEHVSTDWPHERAIADRLVEGLTPGTPLRPSGKYCDQNEISVFSGCGVYRHNTHTDDRVALAAGFRTCVTQGMMVTCWTCQMLREFVGPAFSSGGWIKMKYLKPMYAGDDITLRAVVDEHRDGLLSFRTWAENQDGLVTAVGWSRVTL